MGVGEMTALLLSGGDASSYIANECSAQHVERRDGYALLGDPFTQLKAAEKKAGSGQCVLSPQLWALVSECDAAVAAATDEDGFAFLHIGPEPPPDTPGALPAAAARSREASVGCGDAATPPQPVRAMTQATVPRDEPWTAPRSRPISCSADLQAAALQAQYLQQPGEVRLTAPRPPGHLIILHCHPP
jgi:hypothetical protein